MRSLSFINPWFLAAMGAVAIPIIIHLINRRMAYLHRFAAIDFLLRSQRRLAARLQLKQWLLLLVRCAAIVLLSLALARPVLSTFGIQPAPARRPTSLLLILDPSCSMRSLVEKESLFDRARTAARGLLQSLTAADNAAVFIGAEPLRTCASGLTFDLAPLLRDLDTTVCSFGATNLPVYIKAALPFLRNSSLPNKRLCVLTDGCAHGWLPEHREGLANLLKAAHIEAHLLDVSGGERLPNLAVENLRLTRTANDAISVSARIVNYTNRNVAGLPCHLVIGGKRVSSGFADVQAGSATDKEFSCGRLPWGYHVAEVHIEPQPSLDVLAVDNSRLISVAMDRPVNVLIVDGAPGPHIYASETFYLERALSPDPTGGGSLRAIVVSPEQFAGQTLSGFDCVFLCNVATMRLEKIRELTAFIQRGGGLFISVGDNVDAGYYNQYLAALLPQRLRNKKALAPTSARLVVASPSHPLAQCLLRAGVGQSELRLSKIFLTESSPATSSARVLNLGEDIPALQERRIGAGRALLFTTTIDRDWTDLPIRTCFLPLVQTVARYLAGRADDRPTLDTLVAQPVLIPVPSDVKRVRITGPNNLQKDFESSGVAAGSRRAEVRFSETFLPGSYGVAFITPSPPRPSDQTGFVVNLDAVRESDLSKISKKELERLGFRSVRLPEAVRVTLDVVEHGVERGLWPPLLAGLLFLLTAECWLARKP